MPRYLGLLNPLILIIVSIGIWGGASNVLTQVEGCVKSTRAYREGPVFLDSAYILVGWSQMYFI